jgi:ABC-2 type transport system ATP-binding protein
MLGLIRRTGTEFGIAIVLASHLLGEIERVCDFLVAIEGGQLLRAAPLSSFTERTGVVRVELDEAGEGLGARLGAAGVANRVDGREVFVALVDDAAYDLVRDAIAELGVGLVRIEPERRSLEDLFRDAAAAPVAEDAAAVAEPRP